MLWRPRDLRIQLTLAWLLMLVPGAASAWWNHDWAYRKPVTLDATTVGAPVSNAPVLIRLHEGVFRFTDAAPAGADLRFVAGDDKTPLKYHIERYDEVFSIAFVWVQVPQLKPGEPTAIWMYYGNPKAVAEDDPRGTYDASQALVWHLSERGQPAGDATGNGNGGTASFASVDSGLIGGAARLDQAPIALPATPSLAIAAGASMTWSLWVKPALDAAGGVIFAQRDGDAGIGVSLAAGVPTVTVSGTAGEVAQISASAALAGERWHHLAVVASGGQVTLFIDGLQQGSAAAALPALSSAALLGSDPVTGTGTGTETETGTVPEPAFNGQIDELQVAKVARDAAWIRLAAINQGTEDRLVSFGVDEATSSWDTGYVGIIMGSVTLDGWVIIVILMLMMVGSWVVMARKGSQIGRVGKANRQFLSLYRSAGSDFGALHQMLDDASGELPRKQARLLQQSPLLHMFNTGVEELHGRLQNDKANGVLSAQSIEAIRATIDSSLVREQQALNRQMVLLTIAISGGPFIGLLGTVVGVMITFAGVAAAGDVNVNAIAPGISAALAATVAGMAVAIPALFGYNYLITRIKEVVAEMQVFVDAFITRMAESYDRPDSLRAMAA